MCIYIASACDTGGDVLFSSAVPRSTLAYFQQSGLIDFQDSKGHSLPTVTVTAKPCAMSNALEHGPYQIGIQILGFKL